MKSKFRYWIVVTAGVFVLGTVPGGVAFAADMAWEPAMPRMASSGGEISVERGKSLYGQNCVNCHGVRGDGVGFKKYSWPEEQFIPDLTDPEYMQDRSSEIALSLHQGRKNFDPPSVVMPAFGYVLSDTDQMSVLAYIKTLLRTMPK